MAKVLIGIPTYDRDAFVLDELLQSIARFTYRDFDVLFVDNSPTDDYKKLLESKGFRVIKDTAEGPRKARIVRGRNLLRQAFLQGEWEWFFSLDSDVLCPPDTMEKLMSHNVELISGLYIGFKTVNGFPEYFPVLYKWTDYPNGCEFLMQEVIEQRFMPIAAAGSGCCLCTRDVLARVPRRKLDTLGDDLMFFADAYELGIQAYADTSVRCFHHVVKKGDSRFKYLDIRTYEGGGPIYSYNVQIGDAVDEITRGR